jgi:hypothetical protein
LRFRVDGVSDDDLAVWEEVEIAPVRIIYPTLICDHGDNRLPSRVSGALASDGGVWRRERDRKGRRHSDILMRRFRLKTTINLRHSLASRQLGDFATKQRAPLPAGILASGSDKESSRIRVWPRGASLPLRE